MKRVLTIILFFRSLIFVSQNLSNDYKLVFVDTCKDIIVVPEYQIDSFQELNYNMLNVYIERGNWVSNYSTVLKNKIDTIRIPKLLFSFKKELHANDWLYLKCGNIAEGRVIDYYENGKKMLEGEFHKGKPKEIIEYSINGNISMHYFYNYPKLNYNRVDYYSENGELKEYELFEYKKKKIIKKLYSKKGKFISKEIDKI